MVKQKCWFMAAVLVSAAVAVSGEALAHPPLFGDTESEDKADALRKKGNALSREGRLPEALDAYKESFALRETYATAANLGNLELKLERHRDAAGHLAFALRAAPADASPAVIDALKKSFAEAKTHVSALRIRVGVDSADVTVDGARVDARDLESEVFVDPGVHTVTASRAGHAAARRTVEAAPGSSLEVELAPAALPSAQTAPVAPSPPAPPAPGGAGRKGVRVPLLVGGASTAALGTVFGVVFTVVANGKSSQASVVRDSLQAHAGGAPCAQPSAANAPDCGKLYDTEKSQSAFANAAVWSFIAGGAVALGTGAYALWPVLRGKPRSTTRVRALPAAGARSRGMVIVGEF